VRGLQESGIRAVYAYGSANLSLNDYWNQSKIVIPKYDVRRVRDRYFSSKDGLLTMQLATRGPGFCIDDVVTQEWKMARELGLPITVHVAMGRLAGRFGMIKQLQRLNLLGSDTTYIHCCYFSDEEWHLVKDTGGKISIASQIEMQMGHGQPPVGKALRHGLRPSLSIDVVTTAPGDMFTNMRSAFATDRDGGRRGRGLQRRHRHHRCQGPKARRQTRRQLRPSARAGREEPRLPDGPGGEEEAATRPMSVGSAVSTSRHMVKRGGESNFAVPPAFVDRSKGFRRWALVGEESPAVHTGFAICTLEAGGWVAAHLHSYEETVY